ncbi:MAG: UDP-3-O-(3-hydroxymyristoyl)glucosamine N-acyltransferase [Endomicrobiaceae bacterium]
MKLTLKQVNDIVGGKICGNENAVVTGVNSLEDANDNELSFLGNKKYSHFMKDTKAEAVLFPANMPYEEYGNKNLVIVDNPQLAFAKILTLLDKERLAAIKPGISPKASIAENVSLGENITIGHNAVIEEGSKIGDNTKILANTYVGGCVSIGKNCLIYPNVTIREKTKIGDDCIIHPGVVIGGDGFGFVNTGKEIYKIPQIGHVEIGNNVEIGANTTVDRAAIGKTFIDDNTKIDNLVMVAHNVHIGKNTMIVSQVGIAGSTKIGDNVTIGGQVGIVGHIKIGNNIMIGAKSGVTSNLEDNQVLAGYPIQAYRKHLATQAVMKKLPEIYDWIKTLIKNKEDKKDL